MSSFIFNLVILSGSLTKGRTVCKDVRVARHGEDRPKIGKLFKENMMYSRGGKSTVQ